MRQLFIIESQIKWKMQVSPIDNQSYITITLPIIGFEKEMK